jgi:hypothetical protein
VTHSVDEDVTLVVPAAPEHRHLARLVGCGVASQAGLDDDGVDAVGDAVDELCATLLGTTDRSVALRFRAGDGLVELRGETTGVAYLDGRRAGDRLEAIADRCEHRLTRGRAVIDVVVGPGRISAGARPAPSS